MGAGVPNLAVVVVQFYLRFGGCRAEWCMLKCLLAWYSQYSSSYFEVVNSTCGNERAHDIRCTYKQPASLFIFAWFRVSSVNAPLTKSRHERVGVYYYFVFRSIILLLFFPRIRQIPETRGHEDMCLCMLQLIRVMMRF